MTVATGFDVDYYLDQVGADYYLTAAGEPPGIWAGRGAAALGLRGQVGGDKASAKAMRALFHYGIGPDGVPLSSRQRAPKYPARAVYAQVEEAIAKRVAALGRFATPEERREIRLQERAKMRTSTPYYDMTFSAEKSVSLLYAGLLAAAQQARDRGDEREAERLRAEAARVEAEFARYLTDPERPALLQALRAHEIGGRRIEDSLDAITGRTLDGARSIAAVLHGRLGKSRPRRGARRGHGRSAPPGTPRTRPSRPPGGSTPGRPGSAASSPSSPRSGRCGRGASRRPGPGRCERTGSGGPPSWSPTGKRPGSPTRRRRSAQYRPARRSCARPSTPPWWPWSCPAIRPCCGLWAEDSSRRR